MNDLIIDGKIFSVEQDDFDELTVYGEGSIEFISRIVENNEPVIVSKPKYTAQDKFTKVLSFGNGIDGEFIKVECLTIRVF